MSDIELFVEQKTQRKARNKLTSEMKIDNLKKFAKTSLVAEVILDRLETSRKEIEREI
jgi:hypothetical protein